MRFLEFVNGGCTQVFETDLEPRFEPSHAVSSCRLRQKVHTDVAKGTNGESLLGGRRGRIHDILPASIACRLSQRTADAGKRAVGSALRRA